MRKKCEDGFWLVVGALLFILCTVATTFGADRAPAPPQAPTRPGCVCVAGENCNCPVCTCDGKTFAVSTNADRAPVATARKTMQLVSSYGRTVTLHWDDQAGIYIPEGKGWVFYADQRTWHRPPQAPEIPATATTVAPTYGACGPEGCGSTMIGYQGYQQSYFSGSGSFGGGGGNCANGQCGSSGGSGGRGLIGRRR